MENKKNVALGAQQNRTNNNITLFFYNKIIKQANH